MLARVRDSCAHLRTSAGRDKGVSTVEWIGLIAVVLVLLSAVFIYVQVHGGQVGAAAGSSMDEQIALWEQGGGRVSPYGEGQPAQRSGPDAVPYGSGPLSKMGDLFGGALGRLGSLIRGLPGRLRALLGPRAAVNGRDLERMLADEFGLEGIGVSNGKKDWSEDELRILRDVLQMLPRELYEGIESELTGIVRQGRGPKSKRCIPVVGLCITTHKGGYNPWDRDIASPEDYGKVFLYDGWDERTLVHEMIHPLHSTHEIIDENGNADAYYSQLLDDYAEEFGYEYDHGTGQWQYAGNKGDLPPSDYARRALDPAEDMSEAAVLYVFEPEELRGESAPEAWKQRYEFLKTHVFHGKEY